MRYTSLNCDSDLTLMCGYVYITEHSQEIIKYCYNYLCTGDITYNIPIMFTRVRKLYTPRRFWEHITKCITKNLDVELNWLRIDSKGGIFWLR
jgi:hypothetical protein